MGVLFDLGTSVIVLSTFISVFDLKLTLPVRASFYDISENSEEASVMLCLEKSRSKMTRCQFLLTLLRMSLFYLLITDFSVA